MKVSFKRAAAGLAALAAAASGALLLSARAAEDGYVLHINKDAYVCASPFVADYTLTGEDGQTVFSGEDFVEVYHLTADGAGEQDVSIAAYSVNIDAEAPEKAGYRRVGLEDSGCFSADTRESSGRLCSGRTPTRMCPPFRRQPIHGCKVTGFLKYDICKAVKQSSRRSLPSGS